MIEYDAYHLLRLRECDKGACVSLHLVIEHEYLLDRTCRHLLTKLNIRTNTYCDSGVTL